MTETSPDWHLQAWMRHFGKRQSALANELGWDKGRVSKYWNGRIAYRRDVINEVSAWLGIEPYELLMSPADAIALRRLRETAHMIAAEDQRREWVPAQAGQPGAKKAMGS